MPTPALPKVTVAKSVPADADVLVVAAQGSEPALITSDRALDKAHTKQHGAGVAETAARTGFTAKVGATSLLPGVGGRMLVVAGVGTAEQATLEQARRAAGAGVRAASGLGKGLRVAVDMDATEPEILRAVTEGALLGSYSYAGVRSGDAPEAKISEIVIVSPSADKDTVAAAVVMATAVVAAREWVNLPPNLLYPETFAEEARAHCKGSKVSVDVLDDKALAAGGYGGLTAVGGGSSRKPRLTRLAYAPRGAKQHLVLVGKGITFDSGGLDIKPPASMETMKSDMGGAAAVIAAVRAIADLGLKVKVTAYACMAENMPGGEAYRPSDVLTMYGGTTVENYNTDAEGRLVMADGLARANEDDPDLVVDVATLTGACMVALGSHTFGVMSDDDVVAAAVLDAAEAAGEDAWQLPIPEWVDETLESKVADVRSGGERMGGAQVAAGFLRKFVDADTDWAHLDIAGPAFNEKGAHGYTPSGGTGVAVRTLVELARTLS
ncbi:leucyl aminopeptidase [Mariniluteicoccus endophyticus]